MKFLDSYAGQNWAIVPIARPPRLPSPPVVIGGTTVHDVDITPDTHADPTGLPYPSNQLWQLTLTGVVFCDIQGSGTSAWRQETVQFRPDMVPALDWAARMIGARVTEGQQYFDFDTDLWAPHAVPATTYNHGTSNNSGHGVDQWRPAPFGSATDHFGVSRQHLFGGVRADVVVRDGDAIVHRLAYHVTLVGRLVVNDIVIT